MLGISIGEKCNQTKRVSNLIVVGEVFETRYVVGDLVCNSTNPLGIDAKG